MHISSSSLVRFALSTILTGLASACDREPTASTDPKELLDMIVLTQSEVSAMGQELDSLGSTSSALGLRRRFISRGEFERSLEQQALAEIPSCYGRGHDAIFFALEQDQSLARATLLDCFAPDVESDFVFFGDVANAQRIEGLDALIGFIEGFALQSGYHTARNIPGNTLVEMHDERSATVTASTLVPHFAVVDSISDSGPENMSTTDWFSARYVFEVEKDSSGRWTTVHFDLLVDEVFRTEGANPFGQ